MGVKVECEQGHVGVFTWVDRVASLRSEQNLEDKGIGQAIILEKE